METRDAADAKAHYKPIYEDYNPHRGRKLFYLACKRNILFVFMKTTIPIGDGNISSKYLIRHCHPFIKTTIPIGDGNCNALLGFIKGVNVYKDYNPHRGRKLPCNI